MGSFGLLASLGIQFDHQDGEGNHLNQNNLVPSSFSGGRGSSSNTNGNPNSARRVEAEYFQPEKERKLIQVKGRRNVKVKQVIH